MSEKENVKKERKVKDVKEKKVKDIKEVKEKKETKKAKKIDKQKLVIRIVAGILVLFMVLPMIASLIMAFAY